MDRFVFAGIESWGDMATKGQATYPGLIDFRPSEAP